MNTEKITIRLAREGAVKEYQVPFEEGMNVVSALRTIYEKLDRSVSYPACLCRMGRCGACAVKLNGNAVLGCAAILRAGSRYLLEPINNDKVIRDLVCG